MARPSVRLLAFILLFAARGLVADDPLLIVTAGIEPVSYLKDGKPAGIGTDIAVEAFRRMGRAINVQVMPGARVLSMLQAGEADAAFAMAKTADREVFAFFSTVPIIDQPVAMFVLRDSPIRYDGDLGKIASLRVGIMRGARFSTEFEDAIARKLFKKIEEVTEYEQNIQKLSANYIGIMIGPRISVMSAAKKLGKQDLIRELEPPIIPSAPAYMAFSKKGKGADLAAQFDRTLKAMVKDGSYDSIIGAYVK